jgi:hypothetical protein
MNPGQNGPSWAGHGFNAAMGDGSDPRRAVGAEIRQIRPTMRPPGDELGDVTEVRLVADHDEPRALYVLVYGSSPVIPMLSWRVPAQFVDELLVDGTHAIVRARPGHRNVSLVTPPGELPTFFHPRPVPDEHQGDAAG